MSTTPTVTTATKKEIEDAIDRAQERAAWIKAKRTGKLAPIKCKACEKLFLQARFWQIFCSVACRNAHHSTLRMLELELLLAERNEK